MVGRGPGSRRRVRWREPTPSSETNPLPRLVASSARSSYPRRGLLGRVLRRTPPAHPARPSKSPANTVTEKSSTVPSRGTERKNIPAGQTAGTLPRQHPTPLGAPHATHFALLRVSRPTRAPEGQNPTRLRKHQRTFARPPFHVATWPATTQAASSHLNRRHR